MQFIIDNLFIVSLAFLIVVGFFSWFGKSDRERRDRKRIDRQARIYARKVYEAWTSYNHSQAENLLGEYMSEDRTQPKTEKKKKAFNRKKIIALLIKLRELARRGVGGEKANAERMFYEMLNKYGISESELG